MSKLSKGYKNKLSKLSTLKSEKKVEKSAVLHIYPHYPHRFIPKWWIIQGIKKERMFCEDIIKMRFRREKSKIILTFKYSKRMNKLSENVYTMVKNVYNENHLDKKRRRRKWHRLQKI